MVAKKSRIARNPKEKAAAEADEWINQGGTDPEIVVVEDQPTLPKQTKEERVEEEGKKYPHRISFDMSKAQYKRLKWASFKGDRSMNEILREATEEWMKTRGY